MRCAASRSSWTAPSTAPTCARSKAACNVIYGRRLGALACLFGAWALLMLAALALRRYRARAWAARVGGLALLWTPVAVLVPAAFAPGRGVEDALLVLICFALGATQRPAAALAARATRASGRRGRGADRRRARRHAAARARAARAQPGARRALLRDRQRAQVGARRARLRRRRRRAVPGGAGPAGGNDDGRLRDRARRDRGLGADRRGRRRRDPRERRHSRRHRAAAAGPRSPAGAG